MTKILHTYVKFWSILYTNIMYLRFVSLCWQSAFVTCQKRQNVGKFDIKHSILTKKGSNLALFWSKLYKCIILYRFFYKFDEFVLIETNTVIKLTFFLMILRHQSLKSLLVYKYLLLSRFLGKNRKNTVVFVCCRLCFVFFLVIKRLLSKYCQWKPVLCMQVLVGRLSEGFLCFVDGWFVVQLVRYCAVSDDF